MIPISLALGSAGSHVVRSDMIVVFLHERIFKPAHRFYGDTLPERRWRSTNMIDLFLDGDISKMESIVKAEVSMPRLGSPISGNGQ